MVEFEEGRGKRGPTPLFSPPPCPAAPGSSPRLAVTCHSDAAADCVGLKPSPPSLLTLSRRCPSGKVVLLAELSQKKRWGPCTALLCVLPPDRPHKTYTERSFPGTSKMLSKGVTRVISLLEQS